MQPIFLPLENQNNNRSSSTNVIDRYLSDKIDFNNRQIAVSYVHFFDTFHNVSAFFNNNKLKYSYEDKIYVVTFPNGTYTYKDFDNYLHFVMRNNGHYVMDDDKNEIFGINFMVNSVFNCLSVRIEAKYKLIIETENMSRFLGIDIGTYNADFNSQRNPDITMGYDTMFVHCSVVNNSIIPEFNTVIFTCPINKQFGTHVNYIPNEKRYLNCTNTSAQNIKIWLTNQEGKDINFVEKRWGIGIDLL